MKNGRHQTSRAFADKVSQDVAKFGFSVVTVFGGRDHKGFAYSVGLAQSFHHPEILISGLSGSTASILINDCAERIRNGMRFEDKSMVDGLLKGPYRCEFRKVNGVNKVDRLGIAFAYYKSFDFDVLQLVWPDMQGRLPWDQLHDSEENVQELLYLEAGSAKRWMARWHLFAWWLKSRINGRQF
jgi:Domain of unknown function (DUF4262)